MKISVRQAGGFTVTDRDYIKGRVRPTSLRCMTSEKTERQGIVVARGQSLKSNTNYMIEKNIRGDNAGRGEAGFEAFTARVFFFKGLSRQR